VQCELPGVDAKDCKVEITNDALILQGERRSEREENERGVHRSERQYGSFYRAIPLPEGADTEHAFASLAVIPAEDLLLAVAVASFAVASFAVASFAFAPLVVIPVGDLLLVFAVVCSCCCLFFPFPVFAVLLSAPLAA
jgi:hypothetical protein